jgi:hypothetical protein
VDLADAAVLDGRTWRWFTVRLFGLSLESRTWQRLLGERQQPEEASLDEADEAFGVDRE